MAVLTLLRRRLWILALLAISCGWTFSAAAQSAEYKLKAAYLCHFVDYVDWPDGTFAADDTPLVIGILGNDPFGATIDEVAAGLKTKGRALRIERYTSPAQAERCQILFLASSETAHFSAIMDRLQGHPVLTVGDSDEFMARGGMIRFVTENNRIRFRINLLTVRPSHLSISSRLLQLAQVVREAPAPK